MQPGSLVFVQSSPTVNEQGEVTPGLVHIYMVSSPTPGESSTDAHSQTTTSGDPNTAQVSILKSPLGGPDKTTGEEVITIDAVDLTNSQCVPVSGVSQTMVTLPGNYPEASALTQVQSQDGVETVQIVDLDREEGPTAHNTRTEPVTTETGRVSSLAEQEVKAGEIIIDEASVMCDEVGNVTLRIIDATPTETQEATEEAV